MANELLKGESYTIEYFDEVTRVDREIMDRVMRSMSRCIDRMMYDQIVREDWKMAEEYDRFASFAERYVVARAPLFRLGHETEDGWKALKDAEVLYNRIQQQVMGRNSNSTPPVQGAVSQSPANTKLGRSWASTLRKINIP